MGEIKTSELRRLIRNLKENMPDAEDLLYDFIEPIMHENIELKDKIKKIRRIADE